MFMMIVLALFCVVPVLFVFAISVTDEATLAAEGYHLIPKKFSLAAFEYVFASPKQILKAYGTSLFVTVFGTLASLLLTSSLAYGIARKDFRWRKFISFLVTFALLFNAGMVANYITVSKVYHLSDSIWALILPYLIMPWHVFLMKGFLADMQVSLIEAAQIDGCSEFRIFFQIILPIIKPALATVGLLIAFTYWNDWWLAMLYIENPNFTPLQYLLYRILNNIQFLLSGMVSTSVDVDFSKLPNESIRMAMCVLASGPMLFVFPFFQKYFIKGLTVGAVKG
jgi:putative aldouronate transport system permease protein